MSCCFGVTNNNNNNSNNNITSRQCFSDTTRDMISMMHSNHNRFVPSLVPLALNVTRYAHVRLSADAPAAID